MRLQVYTAIFVLFSHRVIAFPAHGSLAGLSKEQLEAIIPMLEIREPASPPGPLQDTSAKLVNDKAHPWQPLRPGDIRGPCPGLNTLASHGVSFGSDLFSLPVVDGRRLLQYLPRNGIASPAQIIEAAQEGNVSHTFNLDSRY